MPVPNVSEVSQVVRTSVTTALGYMEMLENTPALTESKRLEYLANIYAAVVELQAGVRGLMNEEPRSAA